jgi:hypothetical protein
MMFWLYLILIKCAQLSSQIYMMPADAVHMNEDPFTITIPQGANPMVPDYASTVDTQMILQRNMMPVYSTYPPGLYNQPPWPGQMPMAQNMYRPAWQSYSPMMQMPITQPSFFASPESSSPIPDRPNPPTYYPSPTESPIVYNGDSHDKKPDKENDDWDFETPFIVKDNVKKDVQAEESDAGKKDSKDKQKNSKDSPKNFSDKPKNSKDKTKDQNATANSPKKKNSNDDSSSSDSSKSTKPYGKKKTEKNFTSQLVSIDFITALLQVCLQM